MPLPTHGVCQVVIMDFVCLSIEEKLVLGFNPDNLCRYKPIPAIIPCQLELLIANYPFNCPSCGSPLVVFSPRELCPDHENKPHVPSDVDSSGFELVDKTFSECLSANIGVPFGKEMPHAQIRLCSCMSV